MPIKFKFATPEDLESVAALVNSAYRGETSKLGWTTEAYILDGQRTDSESLNKEVTPPNKFILTALEGERRVGCVALELKSREICYFGMLTVDPTLQANGLGRQILERAENFARERGCTTMTMCVIDVRHELIAWYERRGYNRNGKTSAFPYGDRKSGLPKRDDLAFAYFEKSL